MLIRAAELDGMRRGSVDLAFRRWTRPRLRVGTRMRTPIGQLEVLAVDEVGAEAITDDDARRAGATSRAALLAWLDRDADRPIFRVQVRYAGVDPRLALRENAEMSDDQIAQLRDRLSRMDAASSHGPWTRQVLQTIADRPAVRAPDLAADFGLETVVFKRDVRKLKELGLTESLQVGYRLSPRGAALLSKLSARRSRR
jgi:hypothetical protein